MTQQTQAFNPNEHLMQLQGKDYLPVQWRLVWFRSLCPDGTIETELVHLDLDRETEEETFAWNTETRKKEKIVKRANGIAVFRAVVKDGKGGVATGTKSEKAASFPDFIEKAETGSIGRALAALGYGTQFAPELDEEHRLADAPVAQQNGQQSNKSVSERQPLSEEVVKKWQEVKDRAAFLQVDIPDLLKRAGIAKIASHEDVLKAGLKLSEMEKARAGKSA